ncbi:MAG: molybdopterin oxidoreductase family protein [Acidimicrobiales bacterium]
MTIAEPAPADAAVATRTAVRTCPLCEAGCGLEITLRPTAGGAEEVVRIRGDRDDVFSRGYICPKGSTLKQLHDDPDRLRRPLVKRDGAFVEVGWDEAFAEIEARLLPVLERDGRSACAAYVGNPNAHNLAGLLYNRAVLRALGSTNVFSASTVDQRPKEISSALMFGGGLTVAVPDVDRTDFLLMLGANPYMSNGSLATAPDWPGRLEALVARGGSLVVVDPRRSRTAEEATEWVAIRPGADAYLLMAMVQVILAEDLHDLGRLAELVTGLDVVAEVCRPFTPEAVAGATGIEADDIRRLARSLAAAPTACVYGRIGTTTAEFGTIASWLVDVLNVLTGNLDRPGGAMFPKAAAGASNTRGTPRVGREIKLHRHASRVRGLPETFGELPVVALAEEIDTPGPGQVKALITIAGNPVLSTPNSARLDAALAGLECMVAVDIYLNETTRHADVILPAPSALQKGHYDVALLQLALRDVANFSEPVLPLDDGQPDEWEVLARLALVLQGAGATADPAIVDDLMITSMVQGSVSAATGPLAGRDPDEVLAALEPRRGPERILDFLLRTGPYGEGFGADPDGLSLDALLASPHGVDFGPLRPRLPDVLRTPDGMIALAPEVIVADVARLRDGLDGRRDHPFVLIGRRHVRSNNSWMHNVDVLVKGRPRCTMHLHPEDAAALGLADGDLAAVRSRVGELEVPVEVTDAIRRGVVSIPHGWGHDADGAQMEVARRHAGVNSNLLADEELFDAISGNAVLNGIPVEVRAAG